ncbi:hypothetical protein MKX03_030801, partial [Papaver bracteatum]
MEHTLDWYNPNIPIAGLPYGISFPNGREAVNYTLNFNWHWANLRHNRRVKFEQLYEKIPPRHEYVVKRPIINLPYSSQ